MLNKNIIKTLITLFLLQTVSIFAGAIIPEGGVQAKSDGTNVIITWRTEEEVNLKHFVVQRSTINSDFVDVEVVESNNSRYYEYVDESAYKTTDKIYVYRIKIVDNDDRVTYTIPVSVHHNVSSVKRTWGSIKALFR